MEWFDLRCCKTFLSTFWGYFFSKCIMDRVPLLPAQLSAFPTLSTWETTASPRLPGVTCNCLKLASEDAYTQRGRDLRAPWFHTSSFSHIPIHDGLTCLGFCSSLSSFCAGYLIVCPSGEGTFPVHTDQHLGCEWYTGELWLHSTELHWKFDYEWHLWGRLFIIWRSA